MAKKTIKQLKQHFKKYKKESQAAYKDYMKKKSKFMKLAYGPKLLLGDIDKYSKDHYDSFLRYMETWQVVYVVDALGNIGRIDYSNRPLMAMEFDYDPKLKLTPGLEVDTDFGEIKFKQKLDANKEYQLRVQIKCLLQWSEEQVARTLEKTVMTKPALLSKANIHKWVEDHFVVDDAGVTVLEVTILSAKTDQTFELKDMVLKDPSPILLTELYNDIIPISDGECVQTHLNKIYSKFSKKEIKLLKTPRDINEYCKKYDIKHIAYDVKGRVIISHYPHKANSNRKALIYIAYNNHIYPIKNHTLSKVVQKETTPVFVADLPKHFVRKYKTTGVPSNVTMKGDEITSFVSEGKLYHSNNEYDRCLDVLTKFGIADQMSVHTKMKNIGETIEKLYIKSNIDSFMPGSDKLNKGAFNYNNEEIINNNNEDVTEDIVTIDKNKCYASVLANLPYLIYCDQKQDEMIKLPFGDEFICKHRNTNIDFVDEYLYIVEPKLSTILIPHKNIYSGEHLKYAFTEGVEFKVLELQEANRTDNYYKNMVKDCYSKIDNYNFKEMINPLIGRFESSSVIRQGYKVDRIGNTEEALCQEGHHVKIDHDIFAILKETTSFNLFNKKPIAIQIKDGSRVALYKMMKDLNLETKDIIQIKTDSITFYNKPELKKHNKFQEFINQDLEGWKIEEYKPIHPKVLSNINPEMTFELESDKNDNVLCDCYAGAGKTYKILNGVLARMPEGMSVLVTTPSHATLKEYRKIGEISCDVIQKFTYFNITPNQSTIIVDEVGMIDARGWNWLYQMKLLGKQIMCYGDRNQLLPVNCDKSFFAKNWINYFFTHFETLDTNHRNHFTKEYYDALIQSQDKFLMINEIKKYNTPNYWEANVIIAYRQDIRKKYNALMADKLGIKSKIDIGAKLICKTNKLRKSGVYNKFTFEVKDTKDDGVCLTDGQEDYVFSETEINQHFDYAYCRTLYSIQGESRPSFHYCQEDLKPNQTWITARSTYTLISRLKTKNL